jgi:hypothetical protein
MQQGSLWRSESIGRMNGFILILGIVKGTVSVKTNLVCQGGRFS